jgi:3',5'-cyclic AMP phosphodiesterase CpdA
MQTKIMHVSDLHLGKDLVWRSLRRFRPWWGFVDQRTTDGLVAAINDLKPDYIVLSGDIVNKARKGTFKKAASYLRDVFQRAHFPIGERLLIVPGNHDVGIYRKATRDNAKRLHRYRRFLMDLYGEDDPEARRERFFHTDTAKQVIFVCMDSTLKSGRPLAEGQIDPPQRNWMSEELTKKAADLGGRYRSFVKVAVFHHHCVEIKETAPSGNRFMQLLDAGDVMHLLQKHEFQIVLHGHRHFPHQKPEYRSDSGVLTVMGAGTTLCIFPGEQEGWGNNFNWIVVSPEDGIFTIQLYRIDGTGAFVATPLSSVGGGCVALQFPLFRVPKAGYSVESIKQVVFLEADGTLRETVVREKLRVAEPGKQIAVLPFRIRAGAASARIEDFVSLTSDAVPVEKIRQGGLLDGEWKLKNTLSYGDPPITIAYSHVLRQGTAMSVPHYEQMYKEKGREESTAVLVKDYAQHLHMEVHFPTTPRRFAVTPRVRVESLGVEVTPDPSKVTFLFDPTINRCILDVAQPPLDHSFSIVWELPEVWDSTDGSVPAP